MCDERPCVSRCAERFLAASEMGKSIGRFGWRSTARARRDHQIAAGELAWCGVRLGGRIFAQASQPNRVRRGGPYVNAIGNILAIIQLGDLTLQRLIRPAENGLREAHEPGGLRGVRSGRAATCRVHVVFAHERVADIGHADRLLDQLPNPGAGGFQAMIDAGPDVQDHHFARQFA